MRSLLGDKRLINYQKKRNKEEKNGRKKLINEIKTHVTSLFLFNTNN